MGFPKLASAQGIRWVEVALLALTAPFFVFPSPGRLWPVLVFPLLWAVRLWIRRRRPSEYDIAKNRETEPGSGRLESPSAGTPLDAAVILLTVQLLVSSFAAGDWRAMLPKIAGILYGILVFLALARLLRTQRLIRVGLGGFVAGGTALVFFGLTGMIISKEPHFYSIVGTLFDRIPQKNWAFTGAEAGLNPNAVAGVMLLFVPLGLAFSVARKERRTKAETSAQVFCGLLSALFLLVLFLTQAVSAWVALAASLWLVLPSKTWRAIAAVPFAIFIAAVLVFLPEADADASARRDKVYWQEKIEKRHARWVAGIDAVREKPLTGVGVNMLRTRPELGGYERAHAHNQWIHTAAEMGIPGLTAYLALLGGGLFLCRSIWRRAGPRWIRTAARGLCAGQTAHFFFGWGDAIPLGSKPGIFFWVSLALIAALDRLTAQSEKTVPKESSGPYYYPVLMLAAAVVLFALFLPGGWTREPVPKRVLAVSAQTAVVHESPGQTEKIRAIRMISGKPAAIWRSRRGDPPPFVFVFALAADSKIDRLRFTNSPYEKELPGAGGHEVKVEFSMDTPESGYCHVGVFDLKKGIEPQEFHIARSRARWVRLTIRSNHGHPLFTEIGEFEAWGHFDFHIPLLVSYFIWIAGAALVLSAFGFHMRSELFGTVGLRDVFRRESFLKPTALGAVLIGVGVSVSVRSPVPAVLAAGAAVAAAVWLIRMMFPRRTPFSHDPPSNPRPPDRPGMDS